jgi:hypothetical protein
MTLPARYYVTFRASNGSTVKVLRGDGPPKIVGGSGGWDVVSRPRRVAMTQWTGRDPYRMDVPILFDGYRFKDSVEEDIARLNNMSIGHDYDPPPTINIDGAVPVKGATWVIENIDWGDEVYWELSAQGRYYRMRQDAVVHFLQYQAEKRLKITMPKSLPNQFIVPRDGYTLREVAKAMYGNAERWKEIQKANEKLVRDPNKLKKGWELRVP